MRSSIEMSSDEATKRRSDEGMAPRLARRKDSRISMWLNRQSTIDNRRFPAGGIALATIAFFLGGCSLMVCPFHDEFVVHPVDTTTGSVNGVRGSGLAAALRERGHEPTERHAESGTVTHGPLYFEDPFEDKGSEDGQFAWTGEDYLQIFYWRGRFLLNGIAFPVSAVVTPPWTVMCSDGRLSRQALGYDHDAEPCPPDAESAADDEQAAEGG